MLAALAACSTMPMASLPPHVDYAFDARYQVGSDGELRLPASTRALVVRELQLSPPPLREHFEDGQRTLRYPPGSAVHARGALRAYANDDGSLPTLAELLPGATLAR
ncbi:MAG: hypothetical protein KAI24_25310 [Planctomycetes bacterium]|nr:hypothetical protein [Planctomycetota bacterium]